MPTLQYREHIPPESHFIPWLQTLVDMTHGVELTYTLSHPDDEHNDLLEYSLNCDTLELAKQMEIKLARGRWIINGN